MLQEVAEAVCVARLKKSSKRPNSVVRNFFRHFVWGSRSAGSVTTNRLHGAVSSVH